LNGLNLRNAKLPASILPNATLENVALDGADLSYAALSNIKLIHTTAAATDFTAAHMPSALFVQATLVSARFDRAMLMGARFDRCDLTDATFAFANVDGVYWTDSTVTSRTLDSLATADNLDRIVGPVYVLVALSRQFEANGYRRAVRAMNAAIRRSSSPPLWESVLFDATCGYGAASGRLLLMVIGVWLICGAAYYMSLFGNGSAGIYLVATYHRRAGSSRSRRRRLRYGFNISRSVGTAFLFSTLATFTLPLRGLVVREWIMRAQPKSFDFDARGWVRVIAGIQTIVVVLLVTLFLAVYFGSPLDIL
jgi:hypothetical protein